MNDSAVPLLTSASPAQVLIAHPEAGEIAYFPRSGQAANAYVPQLVGVDFRLAGQPGGVSFEACASCQVMLISHRFYQQLRLHTFTHLTNLLGPIVIILDEPGLCPTARDVIQAINSGVQGWFVAPYRPETAVKLLWRLHALLQAAHPSRPTLPETGPAGPRPN